MKKNRIIAGVLSAVIVTGTVLGIALSQKESSIVIQPSPSPTVTVEPTEEPSYIPTATPVPTVQPTTTTTPVPTVQPTPTMTPVQTSQPTPTTTPVPTAQPTTTATPIPTATPVPTPIPTATPTPSVATPYDGMIANPIYSADFLWNDYVEKGCTQCGSHGTCGAYDHSTHTFNSSKCETYDEYEATHCDICGKVKGNGENGTCLRPWCDFTCDCGEFVKQGECHTCK